MAVLPQSVRIKSCFIWHRFHCDHGICLPTRGNIGSPTLRRFIPAFLPACRYSPSLVPTGLPRQPCPHGRTRPHPAKMRIGIPVSESVIPLCAETTQRRQNISADPSPRLRERNNLPIRVLLVTCTQQFVGIVSQLPATPSLRGQSRRDLGRWPSSTSNKVLRPALRGAPIT